MQAALFRPMSVHDVESLLQRLPAQKQAVVRWLKPQLRRAYDRLLSEELRPALLQEVTADFLKHSLEHKDVFRFLLEQVDENSVRLNLQQTQEQQVRLLSNFLNSAEYARRAEVVLGTLYTLTRVSIRMIQLEASRPDIAEALSHGNGELDALTLEDRAAHVHTADLRAHLLMGAVVDAAEQNRRPDRSIALFSWAHRELSPVVGPLAVFLAEADLGPEPIQLPWFRTGAQQVDSDPTSYANETRIMLSPKDFDRVMEMSEVKAEPSPRLKEALARRRLRLSQNLGS